MSLVSKPLSSCLPLGLVLSHLNSIWIAADLVAENHKFFVSPDQSHLTPDLEGNGLMKAISSYLEWFPLKLSVAQHVQICSFFMWYRWDVCNVYISSYHDLIWHVYILEFLIMFISVSVHIWDISEKSDFSRYNKNLNI